LNKPAGLTSNQALQRVKRLLNARKAGHTGSLDPAATGMLPLCFGEATKVCAFLLDADKTYRVTAKIGTATDTGDATGSVIDSADKRLYELARKGETVEREPRPIRIDSIELLEAAGSRLVFRVRCSKGTYVRSLVEDIARAAGTVAHTARLHRETVADFGADEMVDLNAVELSAAEGPSPLRDCLLPPDRALAGLPEVRLDAANAERFCGGQPVAAGNSDSAGLTRVYGEEQVFLGVGELCGDGKVAPRRIFGRPGGNP
jgi:tRNA pseudouridine55 synthase